MIQRCWHQKPEIRPDFSQIVKDLTYIMESMPTIAAAAAPAPSAPGPDPAANVPGWCGSMARDAAEAKLTPCEEGTYLLRWSTGQNSYVLSFRVAPSTNFQHIAYINVREGKITVDKEDGSTSYYDSMTHYIQAMKDSDLIKVPYRDQTNHSLYGMTPNLYDKAPSFKKN